MITAESHLTGNASDLTELLTVGCYTVSLDYLTTVILVQLQNGPHIFHYMRMWVSEVLFRNYFS